MRLNRDHRESNQVGAFDYLQKPVDVDALIGTLRRAVSAAVTADEPSGSNDGELIITEDPLMKAVLVTAAKISQTDLPVLPMWGTDKPKNLLRVFLGVAPAAATRAQSTPCLSTVPWAGSPVHALPSAK